MRRLSLEPQPQGSRGEEHRCWRNGSRTIEAPVEKAFDYAMDIRNLWVAPDIALADVSLKPDGVGSSARIWAHFLGLHMEMGLEYTEVIRPERIVAEVKSFGPDNPVWTFSFEPVDGGTKLTAQGECHIKVPAVGKPMEGLLAREHKTSSRRC